MADNRFHLLGLSLTGIREIDLMVVSYHPVRQLGPHIMLISIPMNIVGNLSHRFPFIVIGTNVQRLDT